MILFKTLLSSNAFKNGNNQKPPKVPKVRKANSQKVLISGPLLGPVHENQFQHYSNSFGDFNLHFPINHPFSCNYCGRRFKKEQYLKYHMIAHSGARPHMCNICGKTFMRLSILSKVWCQI